MLIWLCTQNSVNLEYPSQMLKQLNYLRQASTVNNFLLDTKTILKQMANKAHTIKDVGLLKNTSNGKVYVSVTKFLVYIMQCKT